MNLEYLKKSNKPVEAGEIFVYKMKKQPYGYGRVIRGNVSMGMKALPSAMMWASILMAYIYDAFSEDKEAIPSLSCNRLLIPPILINRRPWTKGFFETIARPPLQKGDFLPMHCFHSASIGGYVDEDGRRLPRKLQPCGVFAFGNEYTTDVEISLALGIKPAPDTLPEKKPKKPRGGTR